jgi:methylphosphotriester-DNA--protein-cysteine methyltransferase
MRRFPTHLVATICLAVLLATGLAVAQGNVFHGNVKSQIFHRQGCRYFDCAACSATFTSREAAIAAGYHPCKVCNP